MDSFGNVRGAVHNGVNAPSVRIMLPLKLSSVSEHSGLLVSTVAMQTAIQSEMQLLSRMRVRRVQLKRRAKSKGANFDERLLDVMLKYVRD